MLTKNEIKHIRSLHQARGRKDTGLFIAEGPKVIGELTEALVCRLLLCTDEYYPLFVGRPDLEVRQVTPSELERVSLQKTPQGCLGLFEIPPPEPPTETELRQNLVLALDGVQDPGNLGSIIRTALWYGIRHIVCSTDTVDTFSPKVVQATMGALARIKITRTDLPEFLRTVPQSVPIYGTFLDGHNIYDEKLGSCGIIVMGNEGNGISGSISPLVTHRLLIPPYPRTTERQIESLNVALATAIVCDNFRRKQS
ncbi:MAG: RNA methyltransferase [Alloprevotella sp.]|nr:RNA methyltransferase [Alloprevotella sp.]